MQAIRITSRMRETVMRHEESKPEQCADCGAKLGGQVRAATAVITGDHSELLCATCTLNRNWHPALWVWAAPSLAIRRPAVQS